MAEQQRLARSHRRQQQALRAEIIRDAVAVWNATFDPARPNETYAETRRLLVALIRDRYPMSVQSALAYYLQARRLAGFTEQFRPVQPPQPPLEELDAGINATGIAAYFVARRAGQQPQQAKNTASVTVSGSVARLVASGGRETVNRSVDNDGRAVGFIRVTDADPCFWCAMQASRGPVFKTEATAISAGQARKGRGFHDHDACIVAPVYENSSSEWLTQSADLSNQWGRVTAGLSGQQARNAWRDYWEGREA